MTITNDLPNRMGATFEARFDSNCNGCSCAIYEGDLMGYVDDVAVCDGCYNEADQENHEYVRGLNKRDNPPVSDWERKVLAAAGREPGKEWVTSPAGTGYVRVPATEPQQEEPPVAIEPGIQALMAAGLLQGQEPGGDGVCHAEIISGDKVTPVDIPVPVDPPTARKPAAPRKSRAKAKPADVPSTVSVEDAAASALARVRASTTQADVALMPNPHEARFAQLAANAKDWDPDVIAAEVKASALQTGLQAAVDSGAMTVEQASALGWMAPTVTIGHNPTQLEVHPLDAPAITEAMEVHIVHPTDPPWAPAYGDAVMAETLAVQEARANPSADLFLDALSAATTVAEEDAILGALDALPPYAGGATHDSIKKELLGVIIDAINYHPRSLQKQIGPSEIGTECDHCLAAKLAHWDQVERGEAWLPTVGTAVHSWIEGAFDRHAHGPRGTRRFLTETRVAVGEIDGEEITGSCDLADVVSGWTWDWKIVGPTTLKSAKAGPSRRYVVQQHLYARGWNRLGVKVTHVGIAYLPRNAMSVNQGVWWSEPYNEQIAIDALERASNMVRNLKAMEAIGGPSVRDKYITGLPRWRSWREPVNGVEKLVEGNSQEGKIVCMDCPRYTQDYPHDPAEALKQLDGLV